MKRLFIIILSILTVFLVFSSCDDNTEQGSSSSEFSKQSESQVESSESQSIFEESQSQSSNDKVTESEQMQSTDQRETENLKEDTDPRYRLLNDLYLYLSDDGTHYSVVDYNYASFSPKEKRNVIIPGFCDGIPVTEIKRGAFERVVDEPTDSDYAEYYAQIVSLSIPETVTKLYTILPSSLEKITVSENNPMYSSVNGALYSKDKKTLICYPHGMAGETVIVPEGTRSIGENAFYGCQEISYLVLPSTLETIGKSSFEGCTHLLSISLPENLELIEENAFNYCYKLVEVINKSSLELEIGTKANGSVAKYALCVHNADSLIEKTDDGYAFIKDTATDMYYLLAYNGADDALILPKDSKFGRYKIYQYSFVGNEDIREIVFSRDVTEVGKNAFVDCYNLKKVEINDLEAYFKTKLESYSSSPFYSGSAGFFVNGVLQTELITPIGITEINDYAFYNCSSIERLVITDNVISVGEQAFMFNYNLTQLITGSGLKIIKNGAFRFCSLPSVVLEQGIEQIGENAFSQNFDLEIVVLPDGVTEIGRGAFFNCPELKSVTLGVGITCINVSTFGGANKLESINIPEGVQRIEEYAFMDCYILEEITLPSTLKSIGEYAFWYCKVLRTVRMPYGVSIAQTAFNNCPASKSFYG